MRFIFGFVITISIFLWLSISAGVQSAKLEKKESKPKGNGSLIVSGAIIGTLVGGSSTIGTAQLAYSYGFSAWWFTLGAGIGCLLLAIMYIKPLRAHCRKTLTGLINETYGPLVGLTATCFSSIGMYINIIAQLISAASIVMLVIPNASLLEGVFISAVLMICYALSGGIKGIGTIGIFKTILLYLTTIGGGLLAVTLSGGLGMLLKEPNLQEGYFDLFNRGIGEDLGNGFSVILGVLSTQSYAQAILEGKSDESAKKGALISACMIPPIGIGGILIGMYMRVQYPNLVSTQFAFPMFIQQNMPPLLTGIIFATLLITVLGTGAGLTLGVSTTIRQDLIQNGKIKFLGQIKNLLSERKLMILILLTAAFVASSGIGSFILDFSFMSMALRAATIFVPLQWVFWVKSDVSTKYVLMAVLSGPLVVLAGNWTNLSWDPLFLGILSSLILSSMGYIKTKRRSMR